MWWSLLILFKSLSYFLNTNLSRMIVIEHVIFVSRYFLNIIFHFSKGTTSHDDSIITILIFFYGFLTDFLNSLNQSIIVSVRIVLNDSHSSVDLNNFLPMRLFPWPVKFNCFEFIWISIFPFKLICSMPVDVTNFLNS